MSITRVVGGYQLRWTSSPGRSYTLESSETLAGPWTTAGALDAAAAISLLTDPDNGSSAQKFYRIVLEP